MNGLPTPIHWLSIADNEVPEDVWLLLHADIPEDEAFYSPPAVMCGFRSSKSGVFLDEKYLCLSEHFVITHFALATDPDGSTINIRRSDEGLPI